MTGTINWNDVFDALDEVGYSGVYNMEISLQCFGEEITEDTAAYSVKIMRNILNKRYGNG
jgi:sugar phosphate isomerase/epimerase